MNKIDKIIQGLSIIRLYDSNPKISVGIDYIWVEFSKERQDQMTEAHLRALDELGWYKDSFPFGFFIEIY